MFFRYDRKPNPMSDITPTEEPVHPGEDPAYPAPVSAPDAPVFSAPDVPAYEVKDAVAEVKAEYEALLADAQAEVEHLKAEVVKHATEIIRLHGIIADTVTPWVRKKSAAFIDGIRAWAAAVSGK